MWFIEPMNPDEPILEYLGMNGEEYRKECLDDLRRNMFAPETQSTDEEEIIWPI